MKELKPTIKSTHLQETLWTENPMLYLTQEGFLSQTGNGIFVIKGPLVKILDLIEKLFLKLALESGAEPVFVPSILSWENCQKSQYLHSFADQALILNQYNPTKEQVAPPEGMASPTVCYHYFSSLHNTNLKSNQAVTAISKCVRKEQGNLNDLSRLTNFTMREVIFLGEEEYCQSKKLEILEKTKRVLDKVFQLSYAVVTASDPFFGTENKIKAQAQLLSESKYEIQARLPFNQSSVSIASFNFHGEVFYSRFDIKTINPALKTSACVGWGYERILFAILAQKGVDFSSPYYHQLLDESEKGDAKDD